MLEPIPMLVPVPLWSRFRFQLFWLLPKQDSDSRKFWNHLTLNVNITIPHLLPSWLSIPFFNFHYYRTEKSKGRDDLPVRFWRPWRVGLRRDRRVLGRLPHPRAPGTAALRTSGPKIKMKIWQWWILIELTQLLILHILHDWLYSTWHCISYSCTLSNFATDKLSDRVNCN